MGRVRLLDAADVRAAVPPEAGGAGGAGGARPAGPRARVVAPPALSLRVDEHDGELHVKGAYVRGAEFFVVKSASGFCRNAARGLPVADGMSMVHSAVTGELAYLVLDHGLLTELRTGAAGAVAADLLAAAATPRVAVVGGGRQARFQLRALLAVRTPEVVTVYARRREQAVELANEVSTTIAPAVTVAVADTVADAVRGADVVVTTTTARRPVVDAGLLTPDRVHAELADVAAGTSPGRERADEITGLCVEDAAVGCLLAEAARARDLGRPVDLPPATGSVDGA